MHALRTRRAPSACSQHVPRTATGLELRARRARRKDTPDQPQPLRLPSMIAKIGVLPMEPASLIMEQKMLRGIKQRAESLAAKGRRKHVSESGKSFTVDEASARGDREPVCWPAVRTPAAIDLAQEGRISVPMKLVGLIAGSSPSLPPAPTQAGPGGRQDNARLHTRILVNSAGRTLYMYAADYKKVAALPRRDARVNACGPSGSASASDASRPRRRPRAPGPASSPRARSASPAPSSGACRGRSRDGRCASSAR
jgi:hypothetical protein